MTDHTAENDVPFFVSAGASRALAEAARVGRDINIAGALYRKVNHGEPAWTDDPTRVFPPDEPTVCIAHGRFIPCRKDGEHRYTFNPYWVKSVRDYQGSTDEALTWEPAWERVNPPAETNRGQS